MGTDGGLNRLDRQSGRFERFQAQAGASNTLSHNYVRSILQDRHGFLWVGTNGGGLNRLNLQTGKFDHFRHVAGEITSISDDVVLALYEDHLGNLWVGTIKGLDCFDPSRISCLHYSHNPGDRFSLSDDWINCIYKDRSGVLWIGTNEGGVNKYLPERNGFISFRHNPDDVTSLAEDRILSIIEDDSGNIWFGTYAGCISKYNKAIAKFKLYHSELNKPNSLSNDMVRQIFKESQDILWVATDGGGLNRIDRATGKYTVFRKNASDPQNISSNRVFSILKDREGTMWITTADGGLNKFDPKMGKFVHYMNDPRNPQSISNNFVRTIVEDRAGYLWLGTADGGLNRFDKKTGLCKRFLPEPGNPNSLSYYRVYYLFYDDKSDILWIGTYGGGLNRFDLATETFKAFRYDPKVPNGINDDYVLCINEDSHGFLWLGTSQGLTRFDRQKEVFHTYTKKDGLPDSTIYAIVEDQQKNLWVSTNRGLSRFNPLSGKFKNFDINDGLQSYEFSTYSFCKGDDGELFFGGIRGFNSFYPEQLTDNAHVPSIVITRFQLFNKDVPIGKKVGRRVLMNRSIGTADLIKLSYKQNVFSFEFSALDYKAPEKNQYAYMMVGLDKEWNYVGNRRFVAYAGIPPGKYTFRVKGSNNDGVWNNDGASLKIIITPPFWQTWWFIGLSALLIGGTAVGIVQMRIRRLTNAKHELEKIVDQRTRELKDLSLTDPLTGLRNRRFILEVLQTDISAFIKYKHYLLNANNQRRYNAENAVFGLFLMDIDFFKKVNDTYGHDAGDQVLKQFAAILTGSVRPDDAVMRVGGEEFLVVLKKTIPEYLPIFAAKILKKVAAMPFAIGGGTTIQKTCSIGYANFPFYKKQPGVFTFEQTIMIADLGLFHAKNHGRNQGIYLKAGTRMPSGKEIIQKTVTSLEFALQEGYLQIDNVIEKKELC